MKDGASNLPALLGAAFDRPAETEVIVCSAGPLPVGAAKHHLTVVALPADTLIPHLWSAGIARARGDRVALTTAQFVPASDWLQRLHSADLRSGLGSAGRSTMIPKPLPAIGRFSSCDIRPSPRRSRPGETDEIAADNAVYDRAAIMEHRDLLEAGFWEPSFHRRFRAAGRKLMLDPELVVVHHGTVSARSFARQRYLHGCAYGVERAERATLAHNLLLLFSSPLITPLLLARVVSKIVKRPKYRAKIVPAFPSLVRFTLAWASGEASGYLATLRKKRRDGVSMQSKGHA